MNKNVIQMALTSKSMVNAFENIDKEKQNDFN